jgi:hypothetical protein
MVAEKRIINELSTDYKLIGLASSLKEYTLCFHLNRLLGCDLRKLKDLELSHSDRTREVSFSVFKAGEEHDRNRFIVFGNKTPGEVLLPELANFDFIIQVEGRYEEEEVKHLVEGINRFPQVMMCTEIVLKKIKNKDRLVYVEERSTQRLMNTKRT